MPTCHNEEYFITTEHCNLHPPACPEGCNEDAGVRAVLYTNGFTYCHCQACGDTDKALCKNGYCIECHNDAIFEGMDMADMADMAGWDEVANDASK